MISLDSSEWANLHHAYGNAADIPPLLQQLETHPAADAKSGPWFELWRALVHHSEVYPASFAAVPHVVRILSASPSSASNVFFQFPTRIEICRQRNNIPVPDALATDYFFALKLLASQVCAASERQWDNASLRAALAAFAISKGSAVLAEAIQELDDITAKQFLRSLR
jgi:hypothetical protein